MISQFLVLSASMSELLIAHKINSFDEVVKASILHHSWQSSSSYIRFIHRTARRRMPFANASSSSAKSVGMYWKVSRKAMTSCCSLSLSVLPIQNMAMLPSRKWKVSAWMSEITFPRYRFCRTRASSLVHSEIFPTRDYSRSGLICMTGKKFKPNISRRLLAYGC